MAATRTVLVAGTSSGIGLETAVAEVIVEALSADPLPLRWQTSPRVRALVAANLADLDGSAVQGVTRTWVGG